jgi:hypothetical protein
MRDTVPGERMDLRYYVGPMYLHYAMIVCLFDTVLVNLDSTAHKWAILTLEVDALASLVLVSPGWEIWGITIF